MPRVIAGLRGYVWVSISFRVLTLKMIASLPNKSSFCKKMICHTARGRLANTHIIATG